MKKTTLVATILSLVSYNCYSLNTNEIKINDLITNQKTEDKLYQNDLRDQYFHKKMNNSSDNSINELVWSEKKHNRQENSYDFSAKMLSARDSQSNRQLLNERQEKFLQGIDREDSSNKITLSIPIS